MWISLYKFSNKIIHQYSYINVPHEDADCEKTVRNRKKRGDF